MKKRFVMGALALGLLLSACGPGAKETQASYHIQEISVDADVASFASLCYLDGGFLALCRTKEQEKSLLRMDENGRGVQTLDLGQSEIAHLAPGSRGLFFTVSPGAEGAAVLVKSSLEGGALQSAELPLRAVPKGMALSLQDLAADAENNVYAAWTLLNTASLALGESGVTVWSESFEPLFTLESDRSINGLVPDGEGRVYADYGDGLRPIDPDSQSWGKALKISDYSGVWPCPSGGFYVDAGDALSILDPAENTYAKILSWDDLDFPPRSRGNLTDSGQGLYFTSVEKLYALKEGPGASQGQPPDGRTALRLVADVTSYHRASIMAQEFNAANEDYKIDLFQCHTQDDLLTLALEISAGKIPDLFLFGIKHRGISLLPAELYAAKGLLTDLYPLIDADEALSRASFCPNLLKAAESGGALYEIPVSFMIEGVVGKAAQVGPRMGWTVSDMKAAIDRSPDMKYPFGPTMLRDSALINLFIYNYDTFVNWHEGTCSFDSEEFIALLELAKMQPAAYDGTQKLEPELFADEEMLVHPFYLPWVNYLQQYPQILSTDEIAYVGYPTPSGVGNAFTYTLSFGISAACRHVDAAWAFLRPLILDDCGTPLSVNKNASEKYFSDVESYEQPGRLGYGHSPSNSYEVTLDYSSDEDIKTLRALIESLDRVARYDRHINTILREESAAYFAGDKSAAEVSGIIQSRVKIYVAENIH